MTNYKFGLVLVLFVLATPGTVLLAGGESEDSDQKSVKKKHGSRLFATDFGYEVRCPDLYVR